MVGLYGGQLMACLALDTESKLGAKIPPKPVAYRFKMDMRFAKGL
jgi:hypothetical protein